jgi:2-phosphosulfolactate phosphatase
MNFHYADLETCHEATGLVIVVDVIRAFSNAAYAFSKGIMEIYPVASSEEALKFKHEHPGALACGEEGGMPPEGFDFGNSPSQVLKLDLRGKILVQRTSAGTQGLVRSVKAEMLMAASFVVANATVKYIQKQKAEQITFVVTGRIGDESRGDEDQACAEYLEGLLIGKPPDPAPYVDRVHNSFDARLHLDPNFPAFPKSDLDLCSAIDAFNFAMPVTKENGHPIMRAIQP